MLKRHGKLVLFLLACGDLVVAATAWGAGYALRALWGKLGLTRYALPPFGDFVPMMVFSLILTALILVRLGLYAPKRTKSLSRETLEVCRAIVIAWTVSYFANMLLRHEMPSRLMMVSVLGAWLALAATYRTFARVTLRYFRKRGWNLRHAAIVGSGRLSQRLYHALKRNSWTGITPQYFIDDHAPHDELYGLKIYRPVADVADILAIKPVDIVFVALPADQHQRVAMVLNRLVETNVDIRVVPDLLSCSFLGQDISQLENLPIISMTYSPQHGWNSVIKRTFDLAFSLVALIVLALPMAVIALLIKLTSPGPVFYRQARTSLAGKPFSIVKFRSMVRNADEGVGAVWTKQGDPRVTKFGKFLRRTNLDELPQLLNILVGQMSLVGPRPERPELIDLLRREVPRYMLRSQVKAGLTGWAQVHGWRGDTDPRKRVQYDLYYITNWTFGLDMWTILLTLFRSFRDPNAY